MNVTPDDLKVLGYILEDYINGWNNVCIDLMAMPASDTNIESVERVILNTISPKVDILERISSDTKIQFEYDREWLNKLLADFNAWSSEKKDTNAYLSPFERLINRARLLVDRLLGRGNLASC